MRDYEIVTLALYRLSTTWLLHVRWLVSVDDTEPIWHGRRYKDLRFEANSLADVLGHLAEECFNIADDAESPADVAAGPPSGGSKTIPLFPVELTRHD